MKAQHARDVEKLLDIPNIGPAMIRDFRLLGITTPNELKNNDPYILYKKLCEITGVRQDPCVLDTYIAAIDFMNGEKAKPWFSYTKKRKEIYKNI
jgi:hypothetical protein